MNKHTVLLNLFVIVTLLSSLMSVPAQAMPQTQGEEPPAKGVLWLRAGAFDPLAGEPAVPTSLRRTLAFKQAGLRLIQFSGPIKDEWYTAIEKAGLQVVSYLPDYGYLVWGDNMAVTQLQAATPLRWSGIYHPFYALHPDLADPAKLPAEIEVTIQVYDHAGADKTVQAILDQAEVLKPPHPVLVYRDLGVRIASDQLTWLASLPDVINVEPYPRFEKMDEVQGQIMAGALNVAGTQPSGPGYLTWLSNTLGFTTTASAYPIVDVTDDGIDDGTATPRHPDLWTFGMTTTVDRLIYNYNWTTDPAADGLRGHGNINASIVGGYNNKTGFPYEDANGYNYGLGINPFGRVAGSKVFKNAGAWDATGTNTDLISNSYALGARISSNSWGCGYPHCPGDYNADSQEYDALVRDARPGSGIDAGNQEMIVVFSAGNDGTYGANTVGSPGTAKNVITVGASENYRPTWTDGCSVGPTGADSAQDIINFSSRGPTDDSRVKPDIVAPGTHIEGAASQDPGYNGNGVCDQYMPAGQTLYAASSGTSHSAPAIAGAASLVYRYYQDHLGGNPPSPAMVKAYMINATRYLTGTGTSALPSNDQGYGEIHLGQAFDGTPRRVVDQSYVFGNSGQVYQAQGNVADTGKPFRVTLAWTDAPGPTVGNAYVNNLDLAVTIGGNTYKGNVFSGGTSVTGGSADPRNNVESVFLPAGQSGAFTIVITATNIAGDGVPSNADITDQDFALVVYNAGTGFLSGVVSNANTGTPIVGASVQASSSTFTGNGTSGAGGTYWMSLPGGIYTVTALAYGYAPNSATGVSVITGMTTTLNFALTPAAMRVVSGTVRDANTGWPLYANLAIAGYPSGTIWNDPVTGFYSVTLPEQMAFDFAVSAWVPGYNSASRTIGPLTADRTENFTLTVNAATCTTPGYQRPPAILTENFDSATLPNLPAGWAQVDVSGAVGDWATNAGTRYPPGGGTHSAPNLVYFNSFDAISGSSTRLYRTTGLNLSSISSAQVSFWMYHDTAYFLSNDRVQAQVSTDGGTIWNNVGAAVSRYDGSISWKQHSVDISAYTGAGMTDVRIGFLGTSAYGNDIHIDDVAVVQPSCNPQVGGLVVGNVYDANTHAALAGARVTNDSGRTFTTTATVDPTVDDSFYTLFSPAGSRTFTATMSNYGAVVTTTNVVQSSTVRQDFYLPAPSRTVAPSSLSTIQAPNTQVTRTLTISNVGGVTMIWSLAENPSVTWLDEMPTSGTVAPSSSSRVVVTFAAPSLIGNYTTTLLITSDDPNQSLVSVPVTMAVETPNITISPTSLAEFLSPGATTTRTLSIGNMGNTGLNWSLAENPNVTWLDELPTSGVVISSSTTSIAITFTAPFSLGMYTTTLHITSDDPVKPQVDVPVTLTVALPDLVITKSGPVTAIPGQTITYTIVYTNLGAAPANGVWITDTLPVSMTASAPTAWNIGSVGANLSGKIEFTATLAGLPAGTITLWQLTNNVVITSSSAESDTGNDNAHWTLTVSPPVIALSATSLAKVVTQNATASQTLTITNMGGSNLTWSLVETPTIPWLSEAPNGGIVVPSGSAAVAVTLNATGLAVGVYTTTLQITSNDPSANLVTVSYSVTVRPYSVYLPVMIK